MRQFENEGPRIFMIMDNCSSHKVLWLDDVEIDTWVIHDINVVQVDGLWCIMHLPNVTALIEPLDQGMIAFVKVRYCACFEDGSLTSTTVQLLHLKRSLTLDIWSLRTHPYTA